MAAAAIWAVQLAFPAAAAAFTALIEARRRQRRLEKRLQPVAPAPKKRPGGGRCRARMYTKVMLLDDCAGRVNSQSSKGSDSFSLQGDGGVGAARWEMESIDGQSDVASESTVSELESCFANGRSRRLIASTASSSSSVSGYSEASTLTRKSSKSSLQSIPEVPVSLATVSADVTPGLEDYAVNLRPLLVTRSELGKILSRMPQEILCGAVPLRPSGTYMAFRELLDALGGSLACMARPSGWAEGSGRVLCLGDGFDYGVEEYTLNGSARTRLVLTGTAIAGTTIKPARIRITDVASREPFIAELMGMAPTLENAMQQPLFGQSALKRRRRTLRHVAEALKALRQKSADKKSRRSRSREQ
mmetsp:Transcript_49506/g.115809  ORF Transcript_49506/g.115809 Transcript_49506/m.115809 type:complete len:360 (-) Transcript_49506:51-1130(-)